MNIHAKIIFSFQMLFHVQIKFFKIILFQNNYISFQTWFHAEIKLF